METKEHATRALAQRTRLDHSTVPRKGLHPTTDLDNAPSSPTGPHRTRSPEHRDVNCAGGSARAEPTSPRRSAKMIPNLRTPAAGLALAASSFAPALGLAGAAVTAIGRPQQGAIALLGAAVLCATAWQLVRTAVKRGTRAKHPLDADPIPRQRRGLYVAQSTVLTAVVPLVFITLFDYPPLVCIAAALAVDHLMRHYERQTSQLGTSRTSSFRGRGSTPSSRPARRRPAKTWTACSTRATTYSRATWSPAPPSSRRHTSAPRGPSSYVRSTRSRSCAEAQRSHRVPGFAVALLDEVHRPASRAVVRGEAIDGTGVHDQRRLDATKRIGLSARPGACPPTGPVA